VSVQLQGSVSCSAPHRE